jgi:hypothetical protein
MAMRWLLGVVAALTIAAAPAPGLDGETLLEAMPKDFILGFQTTNGPMVMQEMVPRGETVDAWSRMITTQIFHNLGNRLPGGMLARLARSMAVACRGTISLDADDGMTNGYPVSTIETRCPRNPQTGKPETTFFRAIGGSDSLYIIQYAFRSVPDPRGIALARAHLDAVTACDTRGTDHPCPDMAAKGLRPQH